MLITKKKYLKNEKIFININEKIKKLQLFKLTQNKILEN
jgi:hypothetical protein